MAAPDKLYPLADQWGVELGRARAKRAIPALYSQQEQKSALHPDSSAHAIERYRQFKRR